MKRINRRDFLKGSLQTVLGVAAFFLFRHESGAKKERLIVKKTKATKGRYYKKLAG
jgi:hypothetical protein